VVAGIVPAAGYGTRLQRTGGSKEVYPIGGRPVMDYEIERQRRAPCDQVRVVTRPEKADVIEHAEELGTVVIEAYPESLARSYFTGIEDLDDDDVALLGYPDSVWEPEPHDGYRTVLEFFRAGDWDVALGLLPAPDMSREEPVTYDHETGRVERLQFKPKHPEAPSTWAGAVAYVGVLRGLEAAQEPGKFFNGHAATGRVGATPLEGRFLDMGTMAGLEHVLGAMESASSAPE
jgi:dTDP-glucose pyrophosphorylase